MIITLLKNVAKIDIIDKQAGVNSRKRLEKKNNVIPRNTSH
jgi:hypothetical protein